MQEVDVYEKVRGSGQGTARASSTPASSRAPAPASGRRGRGKGKAAPTARPAVAFPTGSEPVKARDIVPGVAVKLPGERGWCHVQAVGTVDGLVELTFRDGRKHGVEGGIEVPVKVMPCPPSGRRPKAETTKKATRRGRGRGNAAPASGKPKGAKSAAPASGKPKGAKSASAKNGPPTQRNPGSVVIDDKKLFDALKKHLRNTQPDTAETTYAAVERAWANGGRAEVLAWAAKKKIKQPLKALMDWMQHNRPRATELAKAAA